MLPGGEVTWGPDVPAEDLERTKLLDVSAGAISYMSSSRRYCEELF